MMESTRPALSDNLFVEELRREGASRYHDHHPFHIRMHDGALTRLELQTWVENRYYYQTRIPIKDAMILSKSDDPGFRRSWIRRIHDHDGEQEGEGGLALWLRLAKGVGLCVEEVLSCRAVLPGVRFACDAYVTLVREATLVEAVASSLTEFFSPTLMSRRVEAWERHYPWVDRETLEYFRSRTARAKTDAEQAISFVVQHATTYELQQRCIHALISKTRILWHLLDCVQSASTSAGAAGGQSSP